jgi:steroid delta-isomerase-like uncharacterized protein
MPDSQSRAAAVIQTYYETFNGGNRQALLDLLTEDVVHDINQGGTEKGKAAFHTFLQRMDRSYREQVEDLVVFANEDGTRGAAEFFIRGAYLVADDGLPAAHGQKYRLRVGAFLEISKGKVARVTNYYNLPDWIQQVSP